MKRRCIYRPSLKTFPATPPPSSPRHSPLPGFQLALDGWSNAIRSNYASTGASSLSLPRLRTGKHSSNRKVRPNSVQLLHYASIHPSTFPRIHPFVGLHSLCLPPSSRTQTLPVLWHPAVHLLMFPLFPPAQYLHYLTPSSTPPSICPYCRSQRQTHFLFH